MNALPTVLLVEDEEHSLASMRMALEDNFDCLTALNADEARRMMQENYVHVIFCDHRMPARPGSGFWAKSAKNGPKRCELSSPAIQRHPI